ncbi:hypothetical protein GCM10018962_02950 [Dactylosporangium matsuzakiense]|uniref:Uncharacterized protein n=2 Tax=Dactylosporangium TaxID=35753 RepID=A0A9W6NKY6_9ACTN|nr:hypothetical protein GCM10017581_020670 [Dactylosporangium matsuzakiense]
MAEWRQSSLRRAVTLGGMTQPTTEPVGDPSADEQETLRLDQQDPDATRPMSLADLRDLEND